jgi:hypothetical protein
VKTLANKRTNRNKVRDKSHDLRANPKDLNLKRINPTQAVKHLRIMIYF